MGTYRTRHELEYGVYPMKKFAALLPLALLVWACTPSQPAAEAPDAETPAQSSTEPAATPETAASETKVEPIDITAAVGKAVPFTLRSVDGTVTQSADLKDKVVLLDFWATWCTSCKAATPKLQAMYDAHGKNGFEVYAVNAMEQLDDSADKASKIAKSGEAVTKYQKEHGYTINFAVYGDELIEQWQIGGVPFLVLFDKAGQVAMVRTNASEETLKEIEEKVKELLQS